MSHTTQVTADRRDAAPSTGPGPRTVVPFLLRPTVAWSLLAVAAVGYSLVALFLAWADARAMPEPYLRIDARGYFSYGAVFYAPVVLAAWMLASGVVYVGAWAAHRPPDFSVVLTAMAAATGIGTLATLLPDLVTSPLRASGVIDELAWETSIREHSGLFVFTWCTLALYIGLFMVLFPVAVRRSTRLRGAAAVALGLTAFAVFQGAEYVFIR